MRRVSVIRAAALLAVVAGVGLAGGAGKAAPNTVFAGGSFSLVDCCDNAGNITGAPSKASAYGNTAGLASTINVTGLAGNVGHISVTVQLDATWPDDLQLLLVSPANTKKVLLMANAGGDAGNAVSPDTLVFDDAGSTIPDNQQLKSGTYKPTAYSDAGDCDNQNRTDFPAPAPAGPYGTALSDFNGSVANGVWKLYVIDDCSLANVTGSAVGSVVGWSIDISNNPTAVVLRSFSAGRTGKSVQLRWRTAAESDALGFNVFRFSHGSKSKVNRALIAAKRTGTVRGAAYSLLDRRALGAGSTYRLQVVTLRGGRSWAGTASVRARR
jgi:hypothetical protein